MSLRSLLPIFHTLNRLFFDGSLTHNSGPLVSIMWSDNRLKTTTGFYRLRKLKGEDKI